MRRYSAVLIRPCFPSIYVGRISRIVLQKKPVLNVSLQYNAGVFFSTARGEEDASRRVNWTSSAAAADQVIWRAWPFAPTSLASDPGSIGSFDHDHPHDHLRLRSYLHCQRLLPSKNSSPDKEPSYRASSSHQPPHQHQHSSGIMPLPHEAQRDHSRPCSILILPLEVLLGIDTYVIASGGLIATIRLSLVCRSWRQLFLSTPKLWSDARLLEFNKAGSREPQAVDLLALSAARSENQITHADLRHFCSVLSLLRCLVLLLPSAETLVDLQLKDNEICSCMAYIRIGSGQSRRQEPARDVTLPAMHLLAHSCNLEHLVLQFHVHLAPKFAIACSAAPRKLELISPFLCHRCAQGPQTDPHMIAPEQNTAFFRQLTSRAEHMTFRGKGNNPWSHWAFTLFRWRAPVLRSCQLIFHERTIARWAPLQVALLREVRFPYHERQRLGRNDGSVWLQAPAAQRFHGTPELALKVHAPSVRSAFLEFHHLDDLGRLPEALNCWQLLEAVTLEICFQHVAQELSRTGSAKRAELAVRTIVENLTPGKYGAVLSPSLRHLTILVWSEVPQVGSHVPLPPADSPSTASSSAYAGQYRRHILPPVCAELLELQEQRRQLAAEVGTASASEGTLAVPCQLAQPVLAPCVALESIALGGLPVAPLHVETVSQALNAKFTYTAVHAQLDDQFPARQLRAFCPS